ncbi:MAG: hypothetical protein JXB32_18870, partial [Deltaproteobacteria bacterium]|nr:hypothetical protein [Deltaproteobacteria bacterium]
MGVLGRSLLFGMALVAAASGCGDENPPVGPTDGGDLGDVPPDADAAEDRVGPPACGDGVLDPGEECDDADLLPADGCDESCRLEPGW